MLDYISKFLHLPRRYLTRTVLTLLTTLSVNACTNLYPLPVIGGVSAYGSWVELNDVHSLTISPGLFLELPEAPYRAKFADKDGTYFQASLDPQFRTQDGAVSEVQGGLYVLYDKPSEARPWLYGSLGSPVVPYPNLPPLKVQFFSGQ